MKILSPGNRFGGLDAVYLEIDAEMVQNLRTHQLPSAQSLLDIKVKFLSNVRCVTYLKTRIIVEFPQDS